MSALRLIGSGVGLTLFCQMDQALLYKTITQTFADHTNPAYNPNTNSKTQYSFESIIWSNKNYIAYAVIGTYATTLLNREFLENIMYVTQKKFNTQISSLRQTIDNVTNEINNQIGYTYENLMTKLGIVEHNLSDEIMQVKKEMKASFESIESKLHVATLERKYANEGIHLICKSLAETEQQNSNNPKTNTNTNTIHKKIHEFCSIPMAQSMNKNIYCSSSYKPIPLPFIQK